MLWVLSSAIQTITIIISNPFQLGQIAKNVHNVILVISSPEPEAHKVSLGDGIEPASVGT